MRTRKHAPSSPIGSGMTLLAALTVAAGPAGAQEAQLGIFAGRAVDEHGEPHAGLTLAPSLSRSAPGPVLGVGGQATVFQGYRWFGTVRAWGSGTLVEAGRWSISADGEGSLGRSDGGYRSAGARLHPRARVEGLTWRIETGPQLAVAGGAAQERLVPRSLGGALPGPGPSRDESSGIRIERAWRTGAVIDRETFGLGAGWRTVEIEGARWDEWTAEAALAFGRVIVSGGGGARSGDLRETWLAGRLFGRVGPRTSVVMEAGQAPSDPLLRRKGGRYAALGLVLRTGRP